MQSMAKHLASLEYSRKGCLRHLGFQGFRHAPSRFTSGTKRLRKAQWIYCRITVLNLDSEAHKNVAGDRRATKTGPSCFVPVHALQE